MKEEDDSDKKIFECEKKLYKNCHQYSTFNSWGKAFVYLQFQFHHKQSACGHMWWVKRMLTCKSFVFFTSFKICFVGVPNKSISGRYPLIWNWLCPARHIAPLLKRYSWEMFLMDMIGWLHSLSFLTIIMIFLYVKCGVRAKYGTLLPLNWLDGGSWPSTQRKISA